MLGIKHVSLVFVPNWDTTNQGRKGGICISSMWTTLLLDVIVVINFAYSESRFGVIYIFICVFCVVCVRHAGLFSVDFWI